MAAEQKGLCFKVRQHYNRGWAVHFQKWFLYCFQTFGPLRSCWALIELLSLTERRQLIFFFFAMAMKCVIPLGWDLLLWHSLDEDVLSRSSVEFFILVAICWRQSSVFLVSRFSSALQVVKECHLVAKGLSDNLLNEGCSYNFDVALFLFQFLLH